MDTSPKSHRRFFEECGRRGGLKRANHLSPEKRSAIASRAAHARWKSDANHSQLMSSVRFDHPRLDDPAYLEEVLSEGSLKDWSQIYQKIADQPFGATAQTLEKVLSSTYSYGATPLWRGILHTARGSFS